MCYLAGETVSSSLAEFSLEESSSFRIRLFAFTWQTAGKFQNSLNTVWQLLHRHGDIGDLIN
jgi:hypothetical protein